jgi:hypothetical protein
VTARQIPDFFVIGAYRSGTTYLHRALGQHPQVFVPALKEPNFFAVDGNDDATPELLMRSVVDPAEYERLYCGASDSQRCGDVSPEYLRNPAAPRRIRRTHPDAPLVAILRNPVERAYSDYLQHRARGSEPCDTFSEALDQQDERRAGLSRSAPHYLDSGRYGIQLQRYTALFDPEQILVLLYEDLQADAADVARRVFEHVGVDPSVVVELESDVNASGLPRNVAYRALLRARRSVGTRLSPRAIESVRPYWDRAMRRGLVKPQLDATDRHRLVEIYRDDVEGLQTLIGRDLGHWLREDRDVDR